MTPPPGTQSCPPGAAGIACHRTSDLTMNARSAAPGCTPARAAVPSRISSRRSPGPIRSGPAPIRTTAPLPRRPADRAG